MTAGEEEGEERGVETGGGEGTVAHDCAECLLVEIVSRWRKGRRKGKYRSPLEERAA